jgi:hypothetical protein
MPTTTGRDHDDVFHPGDEFVFDFVDRRAYIDHHDVPGLHAGHGGVHDNDDHAIDYVLVRRDDYDKLVAAVNHWEHNNGADLVYDVLDAANVLIDHGPGEYDYGINDDDIDPA